MQALGLIETIGLIAAIESADAMLKAADVNLLEKTYVGGGLVSIVVTGDVGAVKAAVDAGGAAVRNINDILLVSQHVIPRPHEELDNIIVSAVPLKDRNIKTVNPEENQAKVVTMAEGNEEESVEVPLKIEEPEDEDSKEEDSMIENSTRDDSIVENPIEEDSKEENSTVEDSENEELLPEKITDPLKMDLTKLNRKAVDKIVLDYGLEKAIEILSKFKVIELRNLARKYKNFGIKGRSISKADKMLLLVEFRKYYGHN